MGTLVGWRPLGVGMANVGIWLSLVCLFAFFFYDFVFAGGRSISSSSFSSGTAFMRVLRQVCHWCTLRAAYTTHGDVILLDVDGDPTLGAGGVATLCGGDLLRMVVSSLSIIACLNFSFIDNEKNLLLMP